MLNIWIIFCTQKKKNPELSESCPGGGPSYMVAPFFSDSVLYGSYNKYLTII